MTHYRNRDSWNTIIVSPDTLIVTPSILMHACAAYLSPEAQTFTIIRRLYSERKLIIDSPTQTTLLSLPSEILLAIHTHFIPLMTSHLIQHSNASLTSYESTLLSTLCADCQAYTTYIYGSKVWNWPYFPGPCACAQFNLRAVVGRGMQRCSGLRELTRMCMGGWLRLSNYVNDPTAAKEKKVAPCGPVVYSSPDRWLEAHLSDYVNLHSRHRLKGSPEDTSNEPNIWLAVSSVLHELGCEMAGAGSLYRLSRKYIRPLMAPYQEGEMQKITWQRNAITQEAIRELGLGYTYRNFGSWTTNNDNDKVSMRGRYGLNIYLLVLSDLDFPGMISMHMNSAVIHPLYIHNAVALARLFIATLALGYGLFLLLIVLCWRLR